MYAFILQQLCSDCAKFTRSFFHQWIICLKTCISLHIHLAANIQHHMICHCSTSCLSTIAKMICNIQQSPNRRTFGNLEIPGERLLFHILFDFRLLSRFFWVSIKTLMQLSLLQGSAPWLPLEEKALHTSKFLPFYLCPIHVARSSTWTCHFWARWELMFLCSYHHFPHHHRHFPHFIWV